MHDLNYSYKTVGYTLSGLVYVGLVTRKRTGFASENLYTPTTEAMKFEKECKDFLGTPVL